MNLSTDPDQEALKTEWERLRARPHGLQAREREGIETLLPAALREPGPERFSAFLRIRRLSLGLTQRDVADRVGMHPTNISQYEQMRLGNLPPRPVFLKGLADVLQTTQGHLLRLWGYDLEREDEIPDHDPMVTVVTSLARDTDWSNVPPRMRAMIEQQLRAVHDESRERKLRDDA